MGIDTTHAIIIGVVPALERFQVHPYGISRFEQRSRSRAPEAEEGISIRAHPELACSPYRSLQPGRGRGRLAFSFIHSSPCEQRTESTPCE